MATRSSEATFAAAVLVHRPAARRPGRLAAAVHLVAAWHERARQRRQLAALSDAMLKDIGLTRADVDSETAKPFWRP